SFGVQMSSAARLVSSNRRQALSRAKLALYMDSSVVVINKPPGFVCQFNRKAAEEGWTNSLMVKLHVSDLKLDLDLNDDLHHAHRLDKGTTGCLVLARSKDSARKLFQQFSSHEIEKTYLALVRGGSASFSEQAGTIRGILYSYDGRVSTKDSGGPGEGKRAIAETDWEVIASSPIVPLTLVKLTPYTGFKHQLRVQMAKCMKAPILGDTVHAKAKLSPKITDVVKVPENKMYLHASQLSFHDCRTADNKKRVRITVGAPLPTYFSRLCEQIKIPLMLDMSKGGLWVNGQRALTEMIPEKQCQPEVGQGIPEQTHIEQSDPQHILEQLDARWLAN
ncbi:pseudouridine synthase, partial [Laetiporus sulphureus 93-53]